MAFLWGNKVLGAVTLMKEKKVTKVSFHLIKITVRIFIVRQKYF